MQQTNALMGAVFVLVLTTWGCLRPPPDWPDASPEGDASEHDAAHSDANEVSDQGHLRDSEHVPDADERDAPSEDADSPDANDQGDTGASPPVHWASVEVGDGFACGLTTEGVAYCWGSNEFGQLGSATTTTGEDARSIKPTLVGTIDDRWKKIAVGFDHACAINADDNLFCWGDNQLGGVGFPLTRGTISTPKKAIEIPVLDVAAGDGHTCVIDMDTGSGVHCWGNNESGQVGNAQLTAGAAVTEVKADGVRAIALGSQISCLADLMGVVSCWGRSVETSAIYDQPTECTDACSALVVLPRIVAGGDRFDSLSLGFDHICAINDDSFTARELCWGDNRDPLSRAVVGKMGGTSDTTGSPSPSGIAGAVDRPRITRAGWAHSCAITEGTNELLCWGSDANGALGRTDVANDTWTYRAAKLGGEWNWVSAGAYTTCGIKTDETLWCWGRNSFGELGIGKTGDRDVPTLVEFP